MRCLAVVSSICWALAGCGGRSQQTEQEPASVASREGCFPLGIEVSDAQLRAAITARLGVSVAEGAVDASEPNELVRGQQLVDAVQVGLEQGLPFESRQILRGFVGELVGEASLPLPPALGEGVQAAMQQELDSFASHWMLEQHGSLEALLTSPMTWVNDELAEHYGLPRPASSSWEAVELPADRRAGLMTLGALLARLPSPPFRATHLTEALACTTLPPPPAVPESIWEAEPKRTAKSIVEQTYGDDQVACQTCHRYYIGYAIALDRYDELGRYRATLDGVPIDTSYSLFMPTFGSQAPAGDTQDLPFATPAELGRGLSRASGVRACLIKKLNQQLGGSELTESELGCILEGLQAKQGNLDSVLATLAPRFAASQ
jgi:hypothetical protein